MAWHFMAMLTVMTMNAGVCVVLILGACPTRQPAVLTPGAMC
jgi:hypothetical protein